MALPSTDPLLPIGVIAGDPQDRGAAQGHSEADGDEGARAVAAVWAATLIFSTGPVVIALATASGPVLSFWRMWIGVPLMATAALLNVRRSTRRPSPRGLRLAVLAGIGFGCHQFTLMTALRTTSVVDVTLMNTLCPIVVGALAAPLFGERPGVAFRLWSLVAMAGAAGVAFVGSTGATGNPKGMALAATNVAFYSVYFVWSKQARAHIDTWPFLFVAFTVSALVVSAFALVGGAPILSITSRDLFIAFVVAAGPGLVGHGMMTWSLKFVPANVPPVVMLTIPLFSGAMAWAFAGQSVTVLKAAAGAFTLGGVLGAVRSSGGASPDAVTEALVLAEEV